jgi:hypothetical protein
VVQIRCVPLTLVIIGEAAGGGDSEGWAAPPQSNSLNSPTECTARGCKGGMRRWRFAASGHHLLNFGATMPSAEGGSGSRWS